MSGVVSPPVSAVSKREVSRQSLSLEGISVSYGGVQALSDVSFAFGPGEVCGLIGPNGAGKTTMINVVTGITRPKQGRVYLDGVDMSPSPVFRRARAGLARTFQNLALFPSMTVRENIACGALTISGNAEREEAVDAVSRRLRLDEQMDRAVTELSLGVRKRVELARALVAKPRLLLLDEPAAGLAESEVAELADVVRQLASTGTSILLVEHDMTFVMSLCDRVFVLDFGRLIAQGSPAQVLANPEVHAAYFGQPHDD